MNLIGNHNHKNETIDSIKLQQKTYWQLLIIHPVQSIENFSSSSSNCSMLFANSKPCLRFKSQAFTFNCSNILTNSTNEILFLLRVVRCKFFQKYYCRLTVVRLSITKTECCICEYSQTKQINYYTNLYDDSAYTASTDVVIENYKQFIYHKHLLFINKPARVNVYWQNCLVNQWRELNFTTMFFFEIN